MRSTTQRGYGWEHQLTRKRLIRDMIEGTPCPRCGLPMYSTATQAKFAGLPQRLWYVDVGHWPGLMFGGPQLTRIEHAYCNRRAGARAGNTVRGFRRAAARRQIARYDRWL